MKNIDTLNDATIKASYDPADPRYQQPIVITVGPNREAANWTPKTTNIAALIDLLSHHKVGNKDGASIVLADMEWASGEKGPRVKNAVKSIFAAGIDIDDGLSSEAIDEVLANLGVLAIRYTTHSHGKTRSSFSKDVLIKFQREHGLSHQIDDAVIRRFLMEKLGWHRDIATTATFNRSAENKIIFDHVAMPKNRVVIPFATPFEVGNSPLTLREVEKEWERLLYAVSSMLDVTLDKACLDLCRLFYLPRHDQGEPFDIALFGGDLFDWRTVQAPAEDLQALLEREFGGDNDNGSSGARSVEGKRLAGWWMTHGKVFQIADALEAELPEDHQKGRNNGGLVTLCPFDHATFVEDDFSGWAINASDSQTGSPIFGCKHNGCQERTTQDFLCEMIEKGWIEETALTDESYLCGEPDAPRAIASSPAPALSVTGVLGMAKAIAEEIENGPPLDDEAIGGYIARIAADDLITTAIFKAMAPKCGLPLTSLSKLLATERKKQKAQAAAAPKAGSKPTKQGHLTSEPHNTYVFNFDGDYDIQEAVACTIQAVHNVIDAADRPEFCVGPDGKPHRLTVSESVLTGQSTYRFEPLELQKFGAALTNHVNFRRLTEGGGGFKKPVPPDVVNQVHATCASTGVRGGNFPHVPQLINTPLFSPTGELLDKPGWYREHGILLSGNFSVPPVSLEPTRAEAQAAVAWLKDKLVDFPFTAIKQDGTVSRDPSEAHALAMIITPFMRAMINDVTPLYFIMKPLTGTGATYLSRIPTMLFDGADPAQIAYSTNEEEMQKTLIASLSEGANTLVFDDVNEFKSKPLVRAMTSSVISGRELGRSVIVERKNRYNWIATGCNPDLTDEMERRVIWINMDPELENVQGRTFRYPDLMGHLLANRAEGVHHILTMIQYWISIGQPKFSGKPRQSYQEWSEKVGGVLEAAGVEGFLNFRKPKSIDPESMINKQFIREMLGAFGEKEATANELLDWATSESLEIAQIGHNDSARRANFNKRLSKMSNQTFEFHKKLVKFEPVEHDDAIQYVLRPKSNAPSAPPPLRVAA